MAPWVRLDDGFADHPKIKRAGPLATWLHVAGLCYASRYSTDGHLPVEVIPTLASFQDLVVQVQTLVDRLVEVKLWERAEGGFVIHDFLDYNPSAEKVKAEREAARQRMQAQRGGRSDKVRENGATSSREVRGNKGRSSASPSPSPSP